MIGSIKKYGYCIFIVIENNTNHLINLIPYSKFVYGSLYPDRFCKIWDINVEALYDL